MHFQSSNRALLVAVVCVWILLGSFQASASSKEGKFLIIHVDGTPVETLLSELEANMLPNIARLFEEGHKVKHGVTVFPSETPLILTRLKKGYDNSEGVGGWAYIDEHTDRTVGTVSVFFQMLAEVSPLSRNHFFFQYPLVNNLVGLSLLNAERLWETHDVLELYWVNTDTVGHLGGKAAQVRSLRKLDFYLGLAASQLEGANLVLYSDHGGTMDDVNVVRYGEFIQEVLGSDLRFFYYPNIFLHEPSKRVELAKKLKAETAVDLAIAKESAEKIVGFSANGYFVISGQANTYQYKYYGEDYFGYSELGYQDEFLTKDEWLVLTKGHLYPAAPPSLFTYLEHPEAGHIVFVFDAPNIPYYHLGPKGHHAGLTRNDMVVPIFYKGPAFAEVEAFDEFWLHELFSKHLTMVDFDAKPTREKHSLTVTYPLGAEAMVSPFYGLTGGAEFTNASFTPWLEYAAYSSFLTRVWVGASYKEARLRPRLRLEAFLGDFKLSWLKDAGFEGKLNFYWNLGSQVQVRLGKAEAGISFFF